jgi:molecular chaperone GrpE
MKKVKPAAFEPENAAGVNPGEQKTSGFAGGPETASAAVQTAADPASDGSGAETADPCKDLKDALAVKENDFAALTDKFLRLAAEFDNFRRRSQKEKEGIYSDSITLIIREILPVLDSLDRACQTAAQQQNGDISKFTEGLDMIQKQVEQVLARLNVTRIDCVGKTFDPELHEAVMHVEDDSVGASVIVEELQKGYCRDDRVIRHSMVKVAN